MRSCRKTRKLFVNCIFGVLLLVPPFAFSQKEDESETFGAGSRCESKSLPTHFFEDFAHRTFKRHLGLISKVATPGFPENFVAGF